MDLGLGGRRALITGGTRGIGLATARALVAEGADVAICGRDAGTLEQALVMLSSAGPGRAIGATCDVGDAQAYGRWMSSSLERLGGVDIFVANASAGIGEPTEAAWSANLSVDMLGLVRGVEALLVPMAQSGGGAIIGVSSMAGLEAMTHPTAYASIKTAMITYAKQLSLQVMGHGIRVNTVSPGPIMVDGGSWDGAQQQAPEIYQQTVAKHPAGRLGSPEEVADAIVWLASARAGWVTGTNIIVDGGFTARTQF